MSKDSPYIGRYVCFGLSDGSFTWGRIKAEGTVNTPHGPKEVFVLTDRMTCYVPKGDLARGSVAAISRRLSAGMGGPQALPGRTDPSTLPDYQQGGYTAALPQATKSGNKNLPVKKEPVSSVPELRGVPELSDVMDVQKSPGLRMSQRAGVAQSSVDSGRQIPYVFRRYGYDTNVRKDQLNLDKETGDIIDREILGLDDLTDDELFLLAMHSKLSGVGLNQGAQNMLQMGLSPVPKDEIAGKAISLLKERKGVKPT